MGKGVRGLPGAASLVRTSLPDLGLLTIMVPKARLSFTPVGFVITKVKRRNKFLYPQCYPEISLLPSLLLVPWCILAGIRSPKNRSDNQVSPTV